MGAGVGEGWVGGTRVGCGGATCVVATAAGVGAGGGVAAHALTAKRASSEMATTMIRNIFLFSSDRNRRAVARRPSYGQRYFFVNVMVIVLGPSVNWPLMWVLVASIVPSNFTLDPSSTPLSEMAPVFTLIVP